MIWVYAIAERPDVPLPAVTGLAGAALEGVRGGGLVAVASRHTDDCEASDVEALWAHETVVERLMARRAVLPMRFGSRFGDVAALHHALTGRHDELLAALDRVRGRVELAVRAVASGPVPVQPTAQRVTGERYVRARLEARDRAEAAGSALHARLAALAVAERRRPRRESRELLRAAYLVERPAVAEFRALAQRLQRERPDAALLCTGPWPPYSFVDGETAG